MIVASVIGFATYKIRQKKEDHVNSRMCVKVQKLHKITEIDGDVCNVHKSRTLMGV